MATTTKFLDTVNYDVVVKSILVGDSGVGKTTLLNRFASDEWCENYIATIGVDFKVMTMERDGKIVKLQLWDTAGQERFRTITHAYYRGAHCVMMVFDVTNRESLDNLSFWVKDCTRYAAENTPMLLVGNKADLVRERVVSTEEGKEIAEAMGFVGYMETSAKNSERVDDAFDTAIDQCLERHAVIGRKRLPPPLPPTTGRNVAGGKRSQCQCM